MQNRNIIITMILLALGFFALPQRTQATPLPGFNTADGQNALSSVTTGVANTGIGWFSLKSNTDGSFNTGVGAGTLLLNVGNQSTGDGVENTAFGAAALLFNTTGSYNTAVGVSALKNNTTGFGNTATGEDALFTNTSGRYNTANGGSALGANITGDGNTAIGSGALFNNTGSNNTALGSEAGSNLTSGDNNIYLGSLGIATESNTIRIGTSGTQDRAFIRGIRGVTTGNNDAIPVLIDTAGQLGTMSSSRRFKRDIKPMDSASEAILALKPVTFHYKSDTKDTPQFGLIAEEVAEVNPDLVVRDENGELYTVRYEQINAMLLNEFLKEHRKVERQQSKIKNQEETIIRLMTSSVKQETTIAELKCIVAKQEKGMEALIAHVREQDATIQKVGAQVEESKPVTKVVLSSH